MEKRMEANVSNVDTRDATLKIKPSTTYYQRLAVLHAELGGGDGFLQPFQENVHKNPRNPCPCSPVPS